MRSSGTCQTPIPFALNPARRWIVAGSTHPGEEDIALAALREVLDGGIFTPEKSMPP